MALIITFREQLWNGSRFVGHVECDKIVSVAGDNPDCLEAISGDTLISIPLSNVLGCIPKVVSDEVPLSEAEREEMIKQFKKYGKK